CRLTIDSTLSGRTILGRTRYHPSGPLALPVAGSSSMPMFGANMRLYTVARLSPGSAEKTNTPCADDFDAVNRLSSTPRFTTALSTALRVVSGTKRHGTPRDQTCTGR